MYGSLVGEDNKSSYSIGIETAQHEKVTEEITNLLEEKGYDYGSIQDLTDTLEVMNTLAFVLEVFVYGFIALITLITVANIINTISTGIDLRRKEFAMLKSVGTTPKGFRKMIALESAFYGIKALIFALPISIVISLVLNKILGSNEIPFEINWLVYGAVVLAVFLIIGASMLYSVSKLKDNSIIETLKDDVN
jgi:putative ABC transport system permease protein